MLEPFIRPVMRSDGLASKLFSSDYCMEYNLVGIGLLVPLVTSLRKVTNGTNASLVTFFKKNTNEFAALPVPSLVTFS